MAFKSPSLAKVLALAHPKKAPNVEPIAEDIVTCSKCKSIMEHITEFSMGCSQCLTSVNIESSEDYTVSTGENYNSGANAYAIRRPVGGGANRALIHALIKLTSNSEVARTAKLSQQMERCNRDCKDKLPQDVLDESMKMFSSLKDHESVSRGNVRLGKIGACLFVCCQKAGITRTQTQIAAFVGVDESHVSAGLNDLQSHHKKNIISIPQNHDPTADYLGSLFEIFEVKEEYKSFAINLIARAIEKRVEGIYTCQIKSRCIGVLYGLSIWLRLNITHDMITEKCEGISRNTYLNVFKAIEKNEVKLRKPFIRHNMPLPMSWKPRTGTVDKCD